MGAIDRTAEFNRILQDMGEKSGIGRATPDIHQQTRIPNEIYTESGRIGHELTQIQVAIEEMKKLNKKKGIFVDTTEEFGQKSELITQSMNHVKILIEKLDQRALSLAGGRTKNASEAAKNALEALKLRHAQNMQEFLAVCQERNKKAASDQQTKAKYQPRYPPNQALSGMEMMDTTDGGGDNRGLMSGQQVREPFQFGNERASAMNRVQKHITEIATMFKQMNEMIALHHEAIQRIDTNVDNTIEDLDTGTSELQKYLTNISGNRTLILKIFAIVLAFIVFYVTLLT